MVQKVEENKFQRSVLLFFFIFNEIFRKFLESINREHINDARDKYYDNNDLIPMFGKCFDDVLDVFRS